MSERDPLWDPSVGDPQIARLEQVLAPLRHRGGVPLLPPRRAKKWPYVAAGGVALAAAAALLLYMRADGASPCATRRDDAFAFEATAGTPRCNGAVAKAGWLPVGTWLETGAADRAHMVVADIGTLDLKEGSRLSLVATGPSEHRLALAQGALHARVNAPPRLFVVETPAATAIDLGCEYDLEVGRDGTGLLRVRTGLVELAAGPRLTVVPMGAEARIAAKVGPGLPVRTDAPPPLRDAVARFDAGDTAALDTIVPLATSRDTMTLWNLLARTDAAGRTKVFAAIEALVTTPEWVLAEDVAAGDPTAISRLREALEGYWLYPETLEP
jgi:hypothetical protein